MKKIVLVLLFSLGFLSSFATHIAGGEMIYVYIGPGATLGTSKYKITLKLFRNQLTGGAAMPASVFIGIFDSGTNTQYPGPGQPYDVPITNGPDGTPVPVDPPPACMTNPPAISYNVGYYDLIVDLPINPNGYTACYQTCCRSNPLINVLNPAVGQGEGSSYICTIPGTNILPVGHNSSPQFAVQLAPVCHGNAFTLNFSAFDPDGDSLVFAYCNAFDRGASINAGNVNPNPPPYQSVVYINGYSGTNPLGSLATINSHTGIISGIAPPIVGKYVVCVCISEYRNGQYINSHRKDFILNVSDCDIPSAQLNPRPTTCDGFTVNFQNDGSNVNVTTWYWDFGDPASGVNNTSNLPAPSHTFTTAGTFTVKFVLNRGLACSDSTTLDVNVFPGFSPGFIATAPLCVGLPVQFTDTTRTSYGFVDSWRWDFGDLTTLADTSHLQNPLYTYTTGGVYNVELKVTNSKGCEKTILVPILINDIPSVTAMPHDTAYCGLDTLQLTGTGTGSFIWTPNVNIIGANTATPLVFPGTPTKYYATLTAPTGCKNLDSVMVTPKVDLTNNIAGPVNICEEDTVTLTGSSNYSSNLTWQWAPAATVESPASSTTRVYPIVTTTYTLSTRWGNHCIATKTHTVIVKPLAIPNAGPDAFVCAGGQTFTQLNASGGVTYQWTPVTGLSNPNIPNPIASPTVPTYYVVAVGVAGCPKLRTDTVFVDVGLLPAISTINDTLICNIDTIQLSTTGTGNFVWTPNYMISSTTVASPLVSPDVPTWYYVSITDAIGCQNKDSVFIDVKDHVTLNAGPDTTVCQTDGFFLNATSDALHYKWTPPTYLNYDTIKRPFVIRPLNTITYHLVGNIGKCQSEDDVKIKVVPYPAANAGPDRSVCPGFSAPLNATGGSSYSWTPVTFLSNRSIPNPLCVTPAATIRYIVAVSDTLGCPKTVKDTVWVIVYPKVIANATPKQTDAVQGQSVYLNATGGISYLWEPATWLNNPNVSNPVSTPKDNITYAVTVTSADGCKAVDLVRINVFNVDADIYVPTAFTPNGDGLNDVLRPKLLGMMQLNYFKVFNRFGEMVFSTSEVDKGWDGNYKGKGQDPATYVWMAEGVTYKGIVKRKKGYAVLIR